MTKLFSPQARVSTLEVKVNGLDGFDLDRDILALAKKVTASKAAIERLASGFLTLAYLACFKGEKGSRKALAETRDKIESVLGSRYRRMFMQGVLHFEYAVPSMAALEAYDWFASEPKAEKKQPAFGVDALRKLLENRLSKCKKAENEEASSEAKLIALLIKNLDKA